MNTRMGATFSQGRLQQVPANVEHLTAGTHPLVALTIEVAATLVLEAPRESCRSCSSQRLVTAGFPGGPAPLLPALAFTFSPSFI